MKEVNIESKFFIYNDLIDLSSEVQDLMYKASQARLKAYAPYSKFHVGVAILLDNGEIVTGNNQENASYPSGLCAERTAIYYAISNYPSATIAMMAIIAGSTIKTTSKPIPPCGACRQAIAEYEVKQGSAIQIFFKGEHGKIVKSNSLSNLLPLLFDKSVL